jgi:hypothetical protein
MPTGFACVQRVDESHGMAVALQPRRSASADDSGSDDDNVHAAKSGK